jgi:hercynylcysteine S-oxide lyase
LDDPLGDLFAWAATIDQSPYLCIPQALAFRLEFCGGEDQIREYCFDLARNSGKIMAQILQTEVMDNKTESLSQCCFTMVRLPLAFGRDELDVYSEVDQKISRSPPLDPEKGPAIVKWIMDKVMTEYNAWIPGKFYGNAAWVRLSAQLYLELKDFEWAAQILSQLCKRVQAGEAP